MCVYRTREIREFNSSLKKASSSSSSSAAVTLTDCSNTINYNITFIFIQLGPKSLNIVYYLILVFITNSIINVEMKMNASVFQQL